MIIEVYHSSAMIIVEPWHCHRYVTYNYRIQDKSLSLFWGDPRVWVSPAPPVVDCAARTMERWRLRVSMSLLFIIVKFHRPRGAPTTDHRYIEQTPHLVDGEPSKGIDPLTGSDSNKRRGEVRFRRQLFNPRSSRPQRPFEKIQFDKTSGDAPINLVSNKDSTL